MSRASAIEEAKQAVEAYEAGLKGSVDRLTGLANRLEPGTEVRIGGRRALFVLKKAEWTRHPYQGH